MAAKFNGGRFVGNTATAPAHVQAAYRTWQNPPPVELYDLENDPWEFRNLADEPAMAEVKRRLTGELARFRKEHRDPLLDRGKLDKLAEEHDHVNRNVKGGRYGKGDNWGYLQYLSTDP